MTPCMRCCAALATPAHHPEKAAAFLCPVVPNAFVGRQINGGRISSPKSARMQKLNCSGSTIYDGTWRLLVGAVTAILSGKYSGYRKFLIATLPKPVIRSVKVLPFLHRF